MSHKIRLGPIAVFLAVVAVVLSVMVVLTAATTHADEVLAKRFAEVTKSRYALEAEGEQLLAGFDEQAAAGGIDAAALGLEQDGDGYHAELESDGYTLTIALTEPDESGNYEVSEWKITKQWNEDDPLNDIWKGE